MGSLAGAAVGGIASIAGGMLSGNAEKDAMEAAAQAAQFNPYNVRGAGGSASFDNGALSLQLDPQLAAIRNQLAGVSGGNLSALDPQALQNLIRGGLGAQFGALPQVGAETQGFLDQSRAGDQALMGLFGQYQGQVNPLAQGAASLMPAGQQAVAGAFGPGVADPLAQFAAQQGAGLLGQDFSGLQQSELARMRAQALPSQERAVDSALTNLFTSGRLGTTGGANQMGRLAEAQNQQDLGFQGASTQTAQNMLNSARATGTNLLGMGQQGLLSGMGQNIARAGTLGGLGLQGAGQAGNLYGGLFNAGGNLYSNLDSRAQQRIAGAQNLFGFGNQITQQGFNQSTNSLQNIGALDAQLRALGGLGGNLGSAAASAGANQANYLSQTGTSPFGAGLMGLGGSVFSSALDSVDWT